LILLTEYLPHSWCDNQIIGIILVLYYIFNV